MENISAMATVVMTSGMLSILCLLALHFTSPEFDPGWRMISEYALGRHKWLLTLFFICWGICSMGSAVLLWNVVASSWATLGLVLIFISGIGTVMGGLFDVKHKLHGTSFTLGVPTLPIGSLLVSYHLIQQEGWADYKFLILLSAHATWIGLLLMAFSMMLLFSGLKKAGVPVGPNAGPLKALPASVMGINGYANRVLVICYLAWPVLMAFIYYTL